MAVCRCERSEEAIMLYLKKPFRIIEWGFFQVMAERQEYV
jgi:hypothetical protein